MIKDWRVVGGVIIILVVLFLILANQPARNEVTGGLYRGTSPGNDETYENKIQFTEDPVYTSARKNMIDTQLQTRDITDEKVLEVMGEVPRHMFVPEDRLSQAYEDHPLPIGEGQTISQPYIVALMTQSLQLDGDEKVLEIGTGSGYQAAVLAEIVDKVYTIEIIDVLAEKAEGTVENLGYDNVEIKNADGYYGWEEYAPFDAIIVTAAANHVPPPLIEQLKEGGLLIIPLGSVRYHQTLTLIKKQEGGELETVYITGVRFVPMTGKALQT